MLTDVGSVHSNSSIHFFSILVYYFRYAKPLLDALVERNDKQGFSARFLPYFEDEDLLMATAVHPHYKLVSVKNMTTSEQAMHIQRRIIDELLEICAAEENTEEGGGPASDEDPFLQV